LGGLNIERVGALAGHRQSLTRYLRSGLRARVDNLFEFAQNRCPVRRNPDGSPRPHGIVGAIDADFVGGICIRRAGETQRGHLRLPWGSRLAGAGADGKRLSGQGVGLDDDSAHRKLCIKYICSQHKRMAFWNGEFGDAVVGSGVNIRSRDRQCRHIVDRGDQFAHQGGDGFAGGSSHRDRGNHSARCHSQRITLTGDDGYRGSVKSYLMDFIAVFTRIGGSRLAASVQVGNDSGIGQDKGLVQPFADAQRSLAIAGDGGDDIAVADTIGLAGFNSGFQG